MISVAEDNEFSVLIADFIQTISGTESFTLKIWIRGTEIPYEYDESFDYHFMQEGIRIMNSNRIDWIFYDELATMRVIYEN